MLLEGDQCQCAGLAPSYSLPHYFPPGCCYTVRFYCMMSTSIKPLSSCSLMFNSGHFANRHRNRNQQRTSLGRKVENRRRRSSEGCKVLNPNGEVADPTRKVPQGFRRTCLLAQRLKFGKQPPPPQSFLVLCHFNAILKLL